jgi:hypothetical protein
MDQDTADETYENMVSALATATTASERDLFLRALLARLRHDAELLGQRLGEVATAAQSSEVRT